ncbi:UNVERIFIED_ORG: tail fiber protein [Hafnia paralvei]|nr:phage tail protein [Hafnia paralvei]
MQSLMPLIPTPDNLFHDGNPLIGEQGTIVTAQHLNNEQSAIRDIQTEILAVLADAKLIPNPDTPHQLLDALNLIIGLTGQAKFLMISNNLKEIADAGSAAISKTLTNLGLGDGSALPVGVPVPYPLATPPTGWLKCNGAPFTAAQYPNLAKAYPSLKLPDLRGEFIRGWDDGRGVDSGRALLSAQNDAQQNITGNFGVNVSGLFSVGNGVFTTAGSAVNAVPANNSNPGTTSTQINMDASRQVRTATETRPRNIAFNYIVRAA